MKKPVQIQPREVRTREQLREHYEIEQELASRLRGSRREDRSRLYSTLYDELFRRVPLHPQLTRVRRPEEAAEIVVEKISLLLRFLRPDTVFLELGAGDCRLAIEVAGKVGHVYALDVSQEVSKGIQLPDNCDFILSHGTDIPIPAAPPTLAYSYQLMEHIHPEDAREQLTNIYRSLAPGGMYICITPNRLSGPHDVSRYFDEVATGFHLKEYTLGELGTLFRRTGFEQVTALVGARGRFMEIPAGAVGVLEGALECLPRRLRRPVVAVPVVRNVLMAAVIGRKP